MVSICNGDIKEVVVIGAGVIGLTTALKIQERGGYHVTILAEHLPGDPKDAYYSSCWAGAHHVTVAGTDPRQKRLDLETFETMWKLSEPDVDTETMFLRLPQIEYYRHKRSSPDALELMPNFRFLAKGGHTVRASVQHISQVLEGGAGVFDGTRKPRSPDGVVVCAGLGARSLGGVEDKNVYPMRGQVALIRAPWVKYCMSMSGGPDKIWTYVIPRRSGDVIIGGTMGVDDWYPLPRPETTREIIERVLDLLPEVAPPSARENRKPVYEDVVPLILEEGCGLRPCRKGGIRLEREIMVTKDGKEISVLHNYGHGGYGYLSCFGSASMVLELLEEGLVSGKAVTL